MAPPRVLGSAPDRPPTAADAPPAAPPGTPPGAPPATEPLACPICNEPMLTLSQLNQHIDDAHTDPPSPEKPPSTNTSPRRKIALDVFDHKFTLSDGDGKPRLSRTHWKTPAVGAICSHATCRTPLNVKNGIVNCRRCGNLFCNDHTDYKAKLANSKNGPIYAQNGIWSKCCVDCYMHKPDLAAGTDVNVVDLTAAFKSVRNKSLQESELERSRIAKRFIRLVDFLVDDMHKPKGLFSALQPVSDAEKRLINWQDDSTAHNCYICLTAFSLFLRKHHCRVCGRVVCDDRFEERQGCSMVVPLDLLLTKLQTLNFSPAVRSRFSDLISADICIRCCRNCKDNLLYDTKVNYRPDNEIVNDYTQLLILKKSVLHHLSKYTEFNTRLRDRIVVHLKDYETLVLNFKKKYYNGDQVDEHYKKNAQLITTVSQSAVMFLKECLVEFNQLNAKYKEINERRAKANKPQAPPPPTFTKKQIREMRESLMVLNEQQFLIEQLINDATKQRKFDELKPLNQNKQELQQEIDQLESKLGEFGF